MANKEIIPLNASSKFAICGLPLRGDSYNKCTFGCIYCFANEGYLKKTTNKNKEPTGFKIANLNWLKYKLEKVYDKNEYDTKNFIDMLLKERITWHFGGMSDCFQPCEKEHQITKKIIDIANRYNIYILFSTKSDTYYDCDMHPELHTFQLSVTNLEDKRDIEPNIPPIKNRIEFFHKLKKAGFKVGIRIQPFLPGITQTNIIDEFKDADYFTIEGIKLVPTNEEQKKLLLKTFKLSAKDFCQMGLLNLKPEIRLKLYKPFIEKLEKYNIPYSIADNDLHYLSKSKCCCGESLVQKSTDFNNTALFYKNKDYELKDVEEALGTFKDCKANHLFASSRQEPGCITTLDFFKKRFDREVSPFSKKFLYAFREKKQKSLQDF